MGPQVDPVVSDELLPATADVVVIGGGIIGVTSALYLAERGLSVVLVEKGHIAGEQSSRNWGWCRKVRRDPREFELIQLALDLWKGMDAHIGAATGFTTTGIAFAADGDTAYETYSNWVRTAAAAGIKADIVSGPEVARLLTGDTNPPKAMLYCATDGRAEPQKATPAIALAARRAGAKIFTDCAARGIETAAGNIVSVVTERGTVRTSRAVVAGGAWTRRIVADLGIPLPQLKVRSSVMRTSPVADGPTAAFWGEDFAFRKRFDGGYTVASGGITEAPLTPDSFRFFTKFIPILKQEWAGLRLTLGSRFATEWRQQATRPLDRISPYEEIRVLDPSPDMASVNKGFAALKRRYPAFKDARMVQAWAGYIDATPDAVPVISEVDTVNGLVIATGFSGHGFGIGPGAGSLIASMVAGNTPVCDVTPFRLTRFYDGSPITPLTGL